MSPTILTYFPIAIGALFLFLTRRNIANSKGLPYPPGPKPFPLLGNALDMPKSYYWLTFADWAKQAIDDLLEKRSSIYSDRPRLVMMNELMGWDWAMSLLPYGQRWRKQHKIFHQYFNTEVVDSYRDIQALESRRMLLRLIESPEGFDTHTQRLFTASILKIIYGIELDDSNDSYLQIAEETLNGVAEAGVVGAFLVDMIPLLKYVPEWLPGASFQKKARHWRELMSSFVDMPFESVKMAMENGDAGRSVVHSALEQQADDSNLDEYEYNVKAVAAISFAGGSDTITSALRTAILALMLHPESQKKAQGQLDAVVGRDRLPEFEDLSQLPYIRAIVMEALRWQQSTPLAVAHSVAEDDEYRGYYIPKGSLVFGNAWAILHDESVYPSPHEFLPERFLNEDGTYNHSVQDPQVAFFGYGRRKCPGRFLGINGLLIAVASLLFCFDISRDPKDDTELSPKCPSKPIMTSGMISHPLPFKCILAPRSSTIVTLVKESLSCTEN